jgi:hypothetical protein
MSDDFYLHEDEWGMIELLPRENYAERQQMVQAASEHSEAHRAPDGVGWTDMFVAPAAEVSIDLRGIQLSALATALGPGWQRAPSVSSGYGTMREEAVNAYAFRGPHDCTFYGTISGDRVTSLCVTRCDVAISAELHRLGTTYQLILCDLWTDVVVDLADHVAVARYVELDSDVE